MEALKQACRIGDLIRAGCVGPSCKTAVCDVFGVLFVLLMGEGAVLGTAMAAM